jgi:hypothetical protein
MSLRTFLVSLAVIASACGGSTEGSPTQASGGTEPSSVAEAAGDGIGSTLGGCPEHEAADGAACDTQGRLCNWKRSDGARATGWCQSGGKWRVVVGPASPCPETPTTHQASQFGGDPAPECTAGLTCVYPSTPLGGGMKCTCTAAGLWNSLCSSNEDGWKDAPRAGEPACHELGVCGGGTGCIGTCSGTIAPGPNGTSSQPEGQTHKSCGCGEDGLMYCAVEACGG